MHNHTTTDENDNIIHLDDMMGMPCDECQKGLYDETTITDDKDGILHCDKCGDVTERYVLPQEYTEYDDLTSDDFIPNSHDSFLNDLKKPVIKCTDSHPALPLIINGNTFEMYGSSCQKPIVKDADLYISLDYNAPVFLWEQPWYMNEGNKKHLRYFIEDMSTPTDVEDFKDFVNFTIQSIEEGQKVHAGCIAGHGRTGTLLAAVVQETMGEQLKESNTSAIDYVRENYCTKAVETLAQVLFLHAEFGVSIPKKEISLVNEFKEMFFQEIGVTFETIVKEGEFMATISVIEALEMAIFRKHNPPPPVVKGASRFNVEDCKNMSIFNNTSFGRKI